MSARRPALFVPAMLLNVFIAAGTFLITKTTLREFPPLVLALVRFVLATALMWPLARLRSPRRRLDRADRGRILLLGVLAIPLNQGLFLYGMRWASATHAALLYALTPTFIILIAAAAGTRPTWRQLLGVALAFAGVFTLLLQRGLHFDPHSLRGDLLILAAVVAWALYLYLGRGPTRRYGPLLATSESLIAGTLVFLPIGLVAAWGFDFRAVSLAGWSGVFYLAWLTSGINYLIFFWGIEHVGPAAVAVWSNLQPPATAVLAWTWFREALPPGFLLSAALVLTGVWIAQRAEPRPPDGPGTAGGAESHRR